jgi:hypothetical protein
LAFKAARRMVEGGRLEPVVKVLPGYRRMAVRGRIRRCM